MRSASGGSLSLGASKALEADGIVERIGTDHIHGNVHLAVEAQLADADR